MTGASGIHLGIFGILCVLSGGADVVRAQSPDYSGTWKLNRSASHITSGAGINGLGSGGVPPTLYISQAANGTVVVGSDINESHARTFRLSKGTIANEAVGVKEAVSISADGLTLTVRIVATPAGGAEVATTLVYRKVETDDPCEKWPTPCRYR